MGAGGGIGSSGSPAARTLTVADCSRGVYALRLYLPMEQTLAVGRLGSFFFPAGYYFYLGSALGPGGLPARLARHWRPGKLAHWHVDWVRQAAVLDGAWAMISDVRLECRWAVAVASLPEASCPAPRLGASDCHCPTHLYHLPEALAAERFAAVVGVLLAQLIDCRGAEQLPEDCFGGASGA